MPIPTRARALHVLVAHGVNLDLLGRRETAQYGTITLQQLNALIRDEAPKIAALCGESGCRLTFFQTNVEATLLNKLSDEYDGVLVNPGAWTHTSLALADRFVGLKLPFVEVHLSNIASRETIRHKSFLAPHAVGVVYGLGENSYLTGLYGLLRYLSARRARI